MTLPPAVRPTRPGPTALERLQKAYLWALRARGLSKHTIKQQRVTFDTFRRYTRRAGVSLELDAINREHMEGYIADLLDTRARSTAVIRSDRMRAFFKWLIETGELAESPMANMRHPKDEPMPPAILHEDQLTRLVRACAGEDFIDIRDAAMIRLLIDTGLRRAELAGIRATDIDWNVDSIMIRGKGGRFRHVWFGKRTRTAMERYDRERRRHTNHNSEGFWLGRAQAHYEPFSAAGVAHVVERRCYAAGIEGVSPHTFRHTFAHHWLASGGTEQELMIMGGWRRPETLRRYTALLAADRARDAQKRLSLSDRIAEEGLTS